MLGRPLGQGEVAEIVRRYEHKKVSEDTLNFKEFYRWLRDEDTGSAERPLAKQAE